MLRFDDMVTENEESESAEERTETFEDVSDLFEMSDDGRTFFLLTLTLAIKLQLDL